MKVPGLWPLTNRRVFDPGSAPSDVFHRRDIFSQKESRPYYD